MMSGNLPDQGLAWSCFDAMDEAHLKSLKAAFVTAKPFPHLVLDGLFPADCLNPIIKEFDAGAGFAWRDIQSGLQRKRATTPGSRLPPHAQSYFNTVNSGPFTRFLSGVTGIADLIPDPALHGGGMHEVEEEGSFEVHVDFDRHPRTFLNNRLAVITYLNEDWGEADGGNLELWNAKPVRREVSIAPLFGRTVIMGQSPTAAHGHPQPVRQGRKRRSVTAYFYTNGLTSAFTSDALPTTYLAHKGHSLRQSSELLLRLMAPPALLMGLRSIKTLAHSTFAKSR